MFNTALTARQSREESDHDAGQKSSSSKKYKTAAGAVHDLPVSANTIKLLTGILAVNALVSILTSVAVFYIATRVNPIMSRVDQISEDAAAFVPKAVTKATALLDDSNLYMHNVTVRSKPWMDMADGFAGAWTADKVLELSDHVLAVVNAAKGSNVTEIALLSGNLLRRLVGLVTAIGTAGAVG